jgi:hypothetical protein
VDNLPIGLTTLVFNGEYKKTIDNLPEYIENIIFLSDYDVKINKLPMNIRKIGVIDEKKIDHIGKDLFDKHKKLKICNAYQLYNKFKNDGEYY